MALLVSFASSPAAAQKIILKDGRTLTGKIAPVASISPTLKPPRADGAPEPRPIVVCDDNLRRYFVAKRQIAEFGQPEGEIQEKFVITQPVDRSGPKVQNVGGILEIAPFDKFGRRTFSLKTAKHRVDVIQGITEITPEWTRVEGLSHVWDLRLATSSIPRETLDAILAQYTDQRDPDARLKVVRLYLQAERYSDAKAALEKLIHDFPELKSELEVRLQSLAQLCARRLLAEIRARRDAGQHQLAQRLLEQFPLEGVSGEILQAVREVLDQVRGEADQGRRALAQMEKLSAELPDPRQREELAPWLAEIAAELSPNTLDRQSAFLRLADDPTLEPAAKLSLALSGWLLGADGATENLDQSLSLFELRSLVHAYLNQRDQIDRNDVLEQIRGLESATPEQVARLLLFMKPPFESPSPDPAAPGLFTLSVRTLSDESDVIYHLQLPPEYDPHRYYPAVVTLSGAATTPLHQVDWWAGAPGPDGARLGQATRQGYIVIAPDWPGETERQHAQYGYSARAHASVLNCLRDACRRFSIDTDRVFLSGHSMGADAAWDIGLAHPDLWAGVIPIAGRADRYVKFYWPNAKNVPLYIVEGELDGDKLIASAPDLDRYLIRGFDVTVAEFLGRGHEHFSDEILHLFDWMQRKTRDFFPKKFEAAAMRPWDNYYWWVEVDGFPQRTVVDPDQWPPPRGARPMTTEASVTASNTVQVRTGAARATIWLSPQLVDFGAKFQVSFNGGRVDRDDAYLRADFATLLEDVRTRGDRQHPFWAKVEAGR